MKGGQAFSNLPMSPIIEKLQNEMNELIKRGDAEARAGESRSQQENAYEKIISLTKDALKKTMTQPSQNLRNAGRI